MIKHSLPCYKFSRSEKATAAQKTKLHGSLSYLISGVPSILSLNKWFQFLIFSQRPRSRRGYIFAISGVRKLTEDDWSSQYRMKKK